MIGGGLPQPNVGGVSQVLQAQRELGLAEAAKRSEEEWRKRQLALQIAMLGLQGLQGLSGGPSGGPSGGGGDGGYYNQLGTFNR